MSSVDNERSMSSTSNAMRLGNALHAKKHIHVTRKSIDHGHIQGNSSHKTHEILTNKINQFDQKLLVFSKKWGEALELWCRPDSQQAKEVVSLFINSCGVAKEASLLSDDKQHSLISELVIPYHTLGILASSSLANQSWKLCVDLGKQNREKLEQVLKTYSFASHGAFFRANIGIDPMKCGSVAVGLGFYHGRLDLLDIWHKKTVSYFLQKDLTTQLAPPDEDLPQTELPTCFDAECNEVLFLVMIAFPLLFSLHRGGLAEELCDALGFEYADKGAGGRGFDSWFASFSKSTMFSTKDFPRQSLLTILRLLIFIISPDGVVRKKEFKKWIPSPLQLSQLDKCWCMSYFGLSSCLGVGARAYLRLQQLDDAAQCAKLGLLNSKKKYVRMECHRVLSIVNASYCKLEQTEDHLTKALGEAAATQLPMLRLLVAKDWAMLLKEETEFGHEADGLIDEACISMHRSRKHMVSLLMTEEQLACEKEQSRPRPPLSRGMSSPSLSISPKSPGRKKRHTVNFHASTINYEMKSKKTDQETVLAAPVGLEEYSNEEGEIDVLAYMENLEAPSSNSSDGEDSPLDVRARGRSRSVYS